MINNTFNVIHVGKKNNQTSVTDADRGIQNLGSTDNAGNSVKLVSGIVRLPSDWDFSVCIGDLRYILFTCHAEPFNGMSRLCLFTRFVDCITLEGQMQRN